MFVSVGDLLKQCFCVPGHAGFDDTGGHLAEAVYVFLVIFVDAKIKAVCSIDLDIKKAGTRSELSRWHRRGSGARYLRILPPRSMTVAGLVLAAKNVFCVRNVSQSGWPLVYSTHLGIKDAAGAGVYPEVAEDEGAVLGGQVAICEAEERGHRR